MRLRNGIAAVLASAAIGLVTCTNAFAALSASATFSVVGGDLQIVLANTSGDNVMNPSQVLTALFFDIAGGYTLTPVSATLSPGSTVLFGSTGGGNVGGEWAYGAGLVGAPNGATKGISSAGLDLFGAPNFNGANLEGPAAVDGLNYGIVSQGDNPATGNKEVTGNVPLIKNSVTFLLQGLPDGLTTADLSISHVFFQYGTALSVVPEPTTMIAGALLLLPFGASTLRMLRRNRNA